MYRLQRGVEMGSLRLPFPAEESLGVLKRVEEVSEAPVYVESRAGDFS